MDRRTFMKRVGILLLLGAAAAAGLRKLVPSLGDQASADNSLKGARLPIQSAKNSTQVIRGERDDAALFSFVILSDLHVNSGFSYPSEHLHTTIRDLLNFETKVEAIVLTGDITEAATKEDYREFRKIINSYTLPQIHANMGNHEYYNIWISQEGAWSKETMPNGKSDAGSREAFMRTFGYEKPYHSFKVSNYQVIMLSQETYVQEKPDVIEGAWYSDEQLQWFKETLAQSKGDRPIFVMIHQPLPAVGVDGGNHQVIRAKEFREILKPYKNVFVFYGHNHQDFSNGKPHYYKETFHLFNNSSVGRVLNSSNEHKNKDSAQGLYVQVYANKVVIRGREFSTGTWIEEANWTVSLK
ncbi:MAG: phosphohydrolase [Paenibacillus sp.]|nr:phosphohydrolase [Paenibacillus sp.]